MDDSGDATRSTDFILKLAEDAHLSDDGASQAILEQLRRLEKNSYFHHVYEKLVPKNYASVTKLASDRAKRRLTDATHRYAEAKRKG